ncbi:helix-turn-helix domain-containing protein [Catellatospora vulcania]|uniref:helix-turn-helix domain-containing protein n=1 Tax=Catellatospora vulcania TaxID=1460450 RepID=UPI0012D40D83|nr:helix-turn-helix domain-containing protein [Catellatospora vulcania]
MSGDTLFHPSDLQLRILRLLRDGATDRAIALRLHMGERTVREQLAKLAEESEAQGRFALGVEAVCRGWLDLEPGSSRTSDRMLRGVIRADNCVQPAAKVGS